MEERYGERWVRSRKDPPQAHTATVEEDVFRIIFWVRPEYKSGNVAWMAVIAHEALHGVMSVLNSRGVDPTKDEAEEAAAYYLGWITYEVLTRLKEKK